MSTLYSTRATAVGGRAGTVRSDDGILDLSLALPPGLGGKGGATNPEQLFAAGYGYAQAFDQHGGRTDVSSTYIDMFERRQGHWGIARRQFTARYWVPLPSTAPSLSPATDVPSEA